MTIWVDGIPKGQPRVRAYVRGKHAGVYDPGTADAWKMTVRAEVLKHWDHKPIEGPVRLLLDIGLPRPKSHFRHTGIVREKAPDHHTSKPDVDNLAKAIMDVLTDIGIWRDDSQVCYLLVAKRYSLKPGVAIVYEEVFE